jgi:hypothetical protein
MAAWLTLERHPRVRQTSVATVSPRRKTLCERRERSNPGSCLGTPGILAVVPQQGLLEPAGAVGLLGHQHPAVLGEGERPQVEQLVVQDAQVQAVRLLVGAGGLDPADVGGVQGDGQR